MKRMLGWMAVVLLCATAGEAATDAPTDARLREAQAALDEALKLRDAGRYPEAVEPARKALTLRETALGPDHLDVARALHVLAGLFREQGRYSEAEPLYLRALALREKALGPDHPDVGTLVSALAILYKYAGRHDEAGPLFRRVLAIREKALGPAHPDVATSRHNLAQFSRDQGRYDEAEPLYRQALAIREKALGPNHLDVALSLDGLASFYVLQGLFEQAEPLFRRAIAIREKARGANHPEVAESLNNLALVFREQGMYDRAEPLFQRAVTILEATAGPDSPDLAVPLTNLVTLHAKQGRYDRAEALARRALGIREKALGAEHPDLVVTLINLAFLYKEQGLYGRAEPFLRRALALSEKTFGPQHPSVANSLNGLAELSLLRGAHAQAEMLALRALDIREKVLDADHPDLASVLDTLARVRWAQRRPDDALPLQARVLALSEQRLRRESLGLSEARLSGFLQHLRADEEHLYALLRAYPDDARVQRLALSAALLFKGRSAEETAGISRAVYRSLGTEARDTFERLRSLRTQRASLSLAGPGVLSPADYQQRLRKLTEEGDALEAELARSSAPLRALARLPSPSDIVDRVAASLPPDSALVEFIAFTDRPVVPTPGTAREKARERVRYLALALFPDGSTRAVDLGLAAPMDRAATRLRDALALRAPRFEPLARALHQLAFKPLLPLLGKTRRLFLSPDGQLGLVPFAALHDGRRFLVDTFDFTYLTSGKDLLTPPSDRAPESAVVVLADPDFHASPSGPTAPAPLVKRSFSVSRAELAAAPWAPLPGTREEAESIQRLFPQARLFLGAEATRRRLLDLSAPGILHVATHGFFLEDAPVVPAGYRAPVHFGALGDASSETPPSDPLLRSGLILAVGSPEAPGAPENAVVTALELAGLNLWGTQLVVLSACDTGRGDVKLGQGVYGLRRAFVVAGAETVVMSLWKVDDGSTRAFMEAYYRNLLEGRGRASALREAMRSLRTTRPHPHDWAPFIAVGSDAPLRLPQHRD